MYSSVPLTSKRIGTVNYIFHHNICSSEAGVKINLTLILFLVVRIYALILSSFIKNEYSFSVFKFGGFLTV